MGAHAVRLTIDPTELSAWRDYIGRSETLTQNLDAVTLHRFLAAVGEIVDADPKVVPEMAHWAYFLPVTAHEDLGPDGHAKRGGFLPPVTLPRRMFAGSSTRFLRPLLIGEDTTCKSRIVDVVHKTGSTGDLVFVVVERALSQRGEISLIERQTIVYRGAGGRVSAVERTDPDALAEPIWTPSPVQLFRFSAVTFNSHRIHYDETYATGEEGYPALVVQGPLVATMLRGMISRGAHGKSLHEFSFRVAAPLFVGQPVRLRTAAEGDEISAIAHRQDGLVAVTARAAIAPKL